MNKAITTFMLTLIISSPSLAKTKITSCKSFNIQPEAQKYYNAKKKGWKRLDRDKDGEACECLKGGSGENKTSCKRWRKKNGKPS